MIIRCVLVQRCTHVPTEPKTIPRIVIFKSGLSVKIIVLLTLSSIMLTPNYEEILVETVRPISVEPFAEIQEILLSFTSVSVISSFVPIKRLNTTSEN